MAKGRRRSARSNKDGVDPPISPLSSPAATPPPQNGVPSNGNDESKCPACTDSEANDLEKEKWIRCDACKTWYHWRCAGNGEDLESIDKWFCTACVQVDIKRVITYRPPTRKSHRKRPQRDYVGLNSGRASDPERWTRMLEGKEIRPHNFQRMKGSQVGQEWLDNDEVAMQEPIIIEKQDGLGMQMPGPDFTVEDVADLVGRDTPLEVIDVATQSTAPGWTLGKWADYFNLEPSMRDKVLNVISLEVSATPLANKILPPRLVRELDWVENFWPNTRKGKGHPYPKVQLYCLMGVSSAWTDWHIDFAGSSVYYHILQGSKIFYFIRPTPVNLAAYQRWSGTEIQNQTWLGDMVDEVVKVELTTGNTMIIPTGWIHAVYTPIDTLVFGGNFLHSYNVQTQLKVRNIEIATQVPKKFRFPMFAKLCWYVGEKYLRDLKAGVTFPPRVLSSIQALADFLVSEARILERGTDAGKKEQADQIPSDRVKDGSAVARELRWRVNQAAGCLSEDEGRPSAVNGKNSKRKRRNSDSPSMDGPMRFKHFRPRLWDHVSDPIQHEDERLEKMVRPREMENLGERWGDWDKLEQDEAEKGAVVTTRTNVIVKVRQTAGGIERERCERIVEDWKWP